MTLSPSWRVAQLLPALLILTACWSSDRSTAPRSGPEFDISDAVHEGGTAGFYFLPPMVAQPTFSGTFDADITTLNPAIAICDVTNGPDPNCGSPTGTPAVLVFATTSTPGITVDLTAPQYQVNWNTQTAGFVVGHTYRVHITATTACGARREMGFADVLLTTTPGQAKQLATGDIIVLQDGRTLPIHFRIETGATGDCWTTKASMPTARYTLGVATVNGILYAVGGVNNNTPFTPVATVEAYDPATNTWTTKASMPTARAGVGVVAVNGAVYAVGGFTTGNVGTVEAYDPATDTWTPKAPMPTARSSLAVATINGILYAVGGQVGNGPTATLEAYDPSTNTWTTKAPMPTVRNGLGVAAISGVLYAVGGANGNPAVYLADLQAYDPSTNTWTPRASMPTPRQGLGVSAINGILYAVGGCNDNSASPPCLATVEAYDPGTDIWTTRVSMHTPRVWLGAAAINNLLYAVGGGSSGAILATVEAYQP